MNEIGLFDCIEPSKTLSYKVVPILLDEEIHTGMVHRKYDITIKHICILYEYLYNIPTTPEKVAIGLIDNGYFLESGFNLVNTPVYASKTIRWPIFLSVISP